MTLGWENVTLIKCSTIAGSTLTRSLIQYRADDHPLNVEIRIESYIQSLVYPNMSIPKQSVLFSTMKSCSILGYPCLSPAKSQSKTHVSSKSENHQSSALNHPCLSSHQYNQRPDPVV